jgi:flagellar assembly factor FliW
MTAAGGIPLKGKVIGFEELENYVLQDAFGPDSPFRLLKCLDSGIAFVAVNPYHIVEEYTFDVEDDALAALSLTDKDIDRVAVLCIARRERETLYVNLRSPLLVNTEKGRFLQVILPNEGYPVSAPIVKKV